MKRGTCTLMNGREEKVWITDIAGLVALAWEPSEHAPAWARKHWILVHAPSGKTIAAGDKREEMINLADRLADCGDWDVSEGELPPRMIEEAAYIIGQWNLERSWALAAKKGL